jgi:hypothetical protein
MVFASLLGVGIGRASASEKEWLVQFGTPVLDRLEGVAVHGRHVYVGGVTQGVLSGSENAGLNDAFVSQFNRRGELQWTRQFGTAGQDIINRSVAARGRRVVVGGSVNAALPDQIYSGGSDGFLRAYDADGDVVWTVQFGTSENDEVRGIAIAHDGSVIAVGHTAGQLTAEPFEGPLDAFVMRVDRHGTVQWIRRIGTSGSDVALGVAVKGHAIYVTGGTTAALPGQTNLGDFDGFLARLTLDGEIEWLTQYGTSQLDAATTIAVNHRNIFVAGHTLGTFAGESSAGGWDGFVAAFDHHGRLEWVRQFGTSGCEQMWGLAADHEGAVVVGQINGVLLANGTCNGGNPDGLVQKYDEDGNVLWTVPLATPSSDNLNGVALKGHDVYVAGVTRGSFPGFTNAGVQDALVARIRPTGDLDDDCDNEIDDD